MTSLDQQLKRLAVPQTQSLLGDQRQRASLLFDKSEAATIDKDELYAIGINGLQELTRVDSQFQIYEKSLFAEASQSFERTQHSKEANEALDKTISEFLIKLSPFFLLRAASKALEWLIYRYRIHLHNVEDLLYAIFPYHSTTAFVKVIQTFRLEKKTGRWYWLKPLQEKGAPLVRGVLLNQCISDPNLLEFMCSIVPKHVEVHGAESAKSLRNVLAFFTSTIVGALQLGKIKETTISALLPYLLGGYKSKYPDYKGSAYIITGQICSSVKVEQSVVQKLMSAVTKHSDGLVREMLMTVLVICQTQDLMQMQKRTFKHLCRVPGLLEHIHILSSTYQTEAFMKLFTSRLVPAAMKDSCSLASSSEADDSDHGSRPQYLSILESLIHGTRVDDVLALHITTLFAEQYSMMKDRNMPEAVFEKICQLFCTVERKYPNAVEKFAKTNSGCDSVQELLSSSSQSLILDLNHMNASVRRAAVEKLTKSESDDNSSLEGIVIARLGDDEPSVVEAVLNLKNLTTLLQSDVLVPELMKLVDTKFGDKDWDTVLVLAVEKLVKSWSDCRADLWFKIYARMLPYLLASSDNMNKEVLDAIFKSQVGSEDVVLRGLPKATSKTANLGMIFCGLVSRQPVEYREQLVNMLMELVKNEKTKTMYVPAALRLIVELTGALKGKTCLQYCRLLFDTIASNLNGLEGEVAVLSDQQSTFQIASKNGLIYHAFMSLIGKLRCPVSLKDSKWWNFEKGEEERMYILLILDILSLLSSHVGKESSAGLLCKNALTVMKKSCLSSPLIYFNLLSAVFCGDEALTAIHQLQVLHFARIALSGTCSENLDALMSAKNATVACLLIALMNEYKPIRTAALLLMKELVKSAKTQPYVVLCKELLKVSEELTASEEYLVQAMSALYTASQSSKPRRKSSAVSETAMLKSAVNDLLELVSYDDCSFHEKEALLTGLSLVTGEDILLKLLPLLSALLKEMTSDTLSEEETRCLHLLIHRFTPGVAQIFEEYDTARECFYACLSAGSGHHDDYLSAQKLALKQVTKSFYTALPTDELRQSLMSHIFDLWVDNENPEISKTFGRKIRSLPLKVQHISVELRKLLPTTAETVKDSKRIRRQSVDTKEDETADNVFQTRPWKRAVLVLETVQSKKMIENVHLLAQDLFDVLKFAIQQERQSSADYFKQLVFSCLLIIYQDLSEGDRLSTDDIKAGRVEMNVELVIQCVRTSNSSQTYHHALMLLSKAVLFEPDRVLHNVMSIFTFMGANIMRQDDSYSFKVLTDTIDSIIPALLKANEDATEEEGSPHDFLQRLKISPNLASSIKHILHVFVDAYPHMPLHRRLPLFKKLMSSLGANKFLWLLLLLIVDSHIVRRKTDSDDGSEKIDGFCLSVCDSFSVLAKVGTAYKLLLYINTELTEVEKKEETAKVNKTKSKTATFDLIDFTHHKLKEVKMFKYALVGLIPQLIAGVDAIELHDKKAKKVVKIYEQTMEECLLFITYVGRALSQETNNYWPALLVGAYRILDELHSLLKHGVFVKVIGGLINNDLPIIRRKTMELLVNKLGTPRFTCDAEQVESFLSLIPLLSRAARKDIPDSEGSTVANRQSALLALRAMCRCFGADNPGKFQPLLPLVSKLVTGNGPTKVKSSAVALLAELVACLRAHAVSSLNGFMPGLLDILRLHDTEEGTDTLLPNSVAAVQKIVEVLPNFISPYLNDLLCEIFRLSSRYTEQEFSQKMHVAHRLVIVRKHLSTDIPSRVFLPCLTKCYNELDLVIHWRTVQPIMTTLAEHISVMTSEDVSSYNNSMLTLFLTALDFRVKHNSQDLAEVAKVEDDINSALVSLVMKLSESTFRPLFYRLYDWATNETASKERLLTFYRLCDCLASKMKNLFTKFVGHVIQNVSVLLDANNTKKTSDDFFSGEASTDKSSELLIAVLDMLYKSFFYDNEGFVTKDRFETLMQPLVQQLENMQGGIERYQERVSKHLVPCLVQLAVAAGDDGSWKPLNYQVCLMTRHSSPSVRFAALQVIESLHDKLGTDYMSLLPETIQFLAELTEDENNEVEQKCHDVIKQMETTLGEPLSKYF